MLDIRDEMGCGYIPRTLLLPGINIVRFGTDPSNIDSNQSRWRIRTGTKYDKT